MTQNRRKKAKSTPIDEHVLGLINTLLANMQGEKDRMGEMSRIFRAVDIASGA